MLGCYYTEKSQLAFYYFTIKDKLLYEQSYFHLSLVKQTLWKYADAQSMTPSCFFLPYIEGATLLFDYQLNFVCTHFHKKQKLN